MNNLRLYKIDINYIKYLYFFDNRVQYNPDREDTYSAKRPYLGVVLKIDKYDYFVPLEHPRQFSQYHFCNKHSKEIEEKANETYNRSIKNHFMKKICCDFRLLEKKSEEYKI